MARSAPRRFRPTLWPTIASTIIFAVLIALGTWQVNRLAWKEAMIAKLDERLHLPAEPLPAEPSDGEAWRYRMVSVTGSFRHDREIHVVAPSKTGDSGYLVITPLMREGGAAVLVNRGWVPPAYVDPSRRPEGQITGTVTVTGMARPGWPQGFFVPDNDTTTNHWFWGDLDAMAAYAGLDHYAPVFVEADDTANPGGLPIGGQSVINLRNDHLQYAITWYLLAAGILGVWFLYHFQPAGEPRRP